MRTPEQRARRLMRCYPRRWRARYGEEFVQLLIDDMTERPNSMLTGGCHDSAFFASQTSPSLAFLARHIA